MTDTINNTNTTDSSAILKELSDIKSSLAVNTNETSNIKSTVNEIKATVREMQSNYITRRESDAAFSESDKGYQAQFGTILEKVSLLNKVLYWVIGAMASTIAFAFFKLIIK